MASGDELVKYITERVVSYMETPKEERRKQKYKEPWTVKWFGMIPFSLSQLGGGAADKRRQKRRKVNTRNLHD
ncbi:YqzE family protein [Paenibacillus sp. XY044]|uniref:YqzE family protein n=1 Tax=Paenibacillus sp. XY044 TaxID=2026089 RepID=UPI000B98FD5B|nr:YqzE family protein [Paenibacillus sp. XY044]OZB96789.1 YqzE family protein [Paenibacillus sp. XY044]